jgi:hypothetical protein
MLVVCSHASHRLAAAPGSSRGAAVSARLGSRTDPLPRGRRRFALVAPQVP